MKPPLYNSSFSTNKIKTCHQLSKIKSTSLRGRTLKKRKGEEEESTGRGWEEEKKGTQMNEDKKTDYDFVLSPDLYFSENYHYTQIISSRIFGPERAVLQNVIFIRLFCLLLHFQRRIINKEDLLLLCFNNSV
jgi:hypothetical protein